jgi:hypothetical protein
MLSPREVFRASRLDEFRRYLSGETFGGEEYTPEMFVDRLTSFEATPKMLAGTAVHRALELAGTGELISAEQLGWKIVFDLDATLDLPTLREVELSRTHDGVTLYGRVDSITGTTVRDFKTTQAFDADRYAESYQWRAYLWMSGRERFVYELLKAKVDEANAVVTLNDYARLTFARYPGLDRDVTSLIEDYAEAVDRLGLLREAA